MNLDVAAGTWKNVWCVAASCDVPSAWRSALIASAGGLVHQSLHREADLSQALALQDVMRKTQFVLEGQSHREGGMKTMKPEKKKSGRIGGWWLNDLHISVEKLKSAWKIRDNGQERRDERKRHRHYICKCIWKWGSGRPECRRNHESEVATVCMRVPLATCLNREQLKVNKNILLYHIINGIKLFY